MTSPEKESALEKLPDNLRRFVEAIASGYTGIEAAKIAGSEANTRDALAVTASRWKKRPDVQAALAEIREEFLVDDDGLFADRVPRGGRGHPAAQGPEERLVVCRGRLRFRPHRPGFLPLPM